MLHAHFDCFSGAAGDMMLASCLDASSDNKLLERIEHDLKKGIPEIANEFKIKMTQVLRGEMGGISAKKVDVISIYNHAPAPLPKDYSNHDYAHSEWHSHSHTDHKSESSEIAHDHNHSHSNHYDAESSKLDRISHSHSHRHTEHQPHLHSEEPHHFHSDCNQSNLESHSHSHSHGHSHSHLDHKGPLRNLPQIKKLLLGSSRDYIPLDVCNLAIQVFTELATAEAFTHGAKDEDAVYFHEVGAIDSIVDVVGTLLALNYLSVSTVSCSALPLGEGKVWTDHGELPVPAFATMRLLIGMPTCKGPGEQSGTITGELVTPTAAALLRVLTGVADAEKKKSRINSTEKKVGRAPNFTPRFIGLGAGTKNFAKHPNVIRLILGDDLVNGKDLVHGHEKYVNFVSESQMHSRMLPSTYISSEAKRIHGDADAGTNEPSLSSELRVASTPYVTDTLTRLEANLDDITSEVLANVIDLLLENGAVDAWVQPIVMKKGRSAHTLSCLFHSESELESVLLNLIFRHTTTLGIRIHRDIERAALHRKVVQVETQYGNIDVKLGLIGKEIVSVKSEFEQCNSISRKLNIPIRTVAQSATKIAYELATLELDDHNDV